MKCPKCGSEMIHPYKRGKRLIRRWWCQKCGHEKKMGGEKEWNIKKIKT